MENNLKQIKEYAQNNIEDMAETHIEIWKDRYWRKSLKQIEYDLEINHDNSNLIETIEDEINRELTDDEKEYIIDTFNQTIIDIFYK